MKKVIHKWFWVWSFDKEEKWLNEMAAKGLVLSSVGFCKYVFEDSLPDAYNMRLELLENAPTHPESEKYIRFLEETGAEHVGSVMRWVYFRKKTEDGAFDLFSDTSSRIKHLNRILALLLPLTIFNTAVGIQNVIMFFTRTAGDFNNLNAIGFLNLALSILLLIGIAKIAAKRKKLKKESQIFE